MSEEEERTPLEDLHELMKALRERYAPASSITDADELLTTGQLFTRLQEIFPHPGLEAIHVYELLKENGYRYTVSNGRWVWMLREV